MTDDGNSTGSNVVWAIALVVIVAIIAAVAFSGGFIGRGGDKKINVDVTAPAAPSR
ncbi:MAG: hypothetical protein ACR2IH_03295 [Pyrinomonadaceae bacterium]